MAKGKQVTGFIFLAGLIGLIAYENHNDEHNSVVASGVNSAPQASYQEPSASGSGIEDASPTPSLQTSPTGAISIPDFLADQNDMKTGTKKIVGPGRMGCMGGSLCGFYDPDNSMAYAMVDISKLVHDDKVKFMTSNPLTGPVVYVQIKHVNSDAMGTNYILSIIR
ncbi:hypothetical protein IFJ82_09570 [Novacetimonas hansenii]|uniref:hypothetical protein n=1 Tax=Novacetimonas hansenii TaxID=436 RepID=UPI0017841654|nr:hypothetical protein [Novacetimonas hansenii]QOF94200.1 hypothetical protein IFJ82_09570 [Novacetimonas hansenii]